VLERFADLVEVSVAEVELVAFQLIVDEGTYEVSLVVFLT
jgi:hypothetical protein